MSGAGTAAKPKCMFCWVCSRRLHARFHRVAMFGDHQVVVHAACAEIERMEIVPGAHLLPAAKQKTKSKAKSKVEPKTKSKAKLKSKSK